MDNINKDLVHTFSVYDATKMNIQCAILLGNIKFWVAKNKANKRNFHDGRYWSYCSMSGFRELFPYMTEGVIRGALFRLESEGHIVTGNYNRRAADRTKWYSLSSKTAHEPQLDHTSELTDHTSELTDETSVIDGALPYSKPYSKTYKNTKERDLDLFERFYTMYGNKKDRKKAESAFFRLKPKDIEEIFKVLPKYIASTPDLKYRKYPATWLNARGWEDEYEDKNSSTKVITEEDAKIIQSYYNVR